MVTGAAGDGVPAASVTRRDTGAYAAADRWSAGLRSGGGTATAWLHRCGEVGADGG